MLLKRIIRGWTPKSNIFGFLATYGTTSQNSATKEQSTIKRLDDTELVIFDKDGTLICFHTLFAPWMRKFAMSVENRTNLSLEDKIYKTLGFCPITNKLQKGVFTEGTTAHCMEAVARVLNEYGMPMEDSMNLLKEMWTEGDHTVDLLPLGNPQNVFQTLADNRIKIAVCTSDNRAGTKDVLDHMNLTKYVSTMICGDDPHSIAKPAPDNAWRICRELGVNPEKSVMIGDSRADILMGKSAGLGLTVGVLTGATLEQELLDFGADCVVNDIDRLLPLIVDTTTENSKYRQMGRNQEVANCGLVQRKQNFSTFSRSFVLNNSVYGQKRTFGTHKKKL